MTILCLLLTLVILAAVLRLDVQRRASMRERMELSAAWTSERASIERRAGEQEHQLQAILSSMEEGVLVVDIHQKIIQANASLRKFFTLGTCPVGQPVEQVLPFPELARLLQAAIAQREPQEGEMIAPAGASGDSTHLVLSVTPQRGAGGILGSIAVFRDVSRLRRLEELRREFVANVSHELRTPLAIFHGYLENLLEQDEYLAEEVRPVLHIMRKHSLRLNALVEDLLTLTRLESRGHTLKKEELSLPRVLAEVEQDWREKLQARSVELQLHLPPTEGTLLADPLRLRQVLDNLLDNAAKYTPTGGRIRLSATREGAETVLAVEDTGAGIPTEDLPHIFERFYRADKARSRELGGTGLGLSIVKHIAQAHGGSVQAESRLGEGTRIILRLPGGEEEN